VRGRLAQLVERLLYTQNVGGSSPSPPTSVFKALAGKLCGAELSNSSLGNAGGNSEHFSEDKKSMSSATRGQRGHHPSLRASSFVPSL
jgi:hypothetical protein